MQESKPKKRPRHSTTVYLPRQHNEFLVRSIKARGEDIFGKAENLGKTSKYIIHLIKKDLIEAGLMTKSGEPIPEKLEEIEKERSEGGGL